MGIELVYSQGQHQRKEKEAHARPASNLRLFDR
jgi:hypothetical protein